MRLYDTSVLQVDKLTELNLIDLSKIIPTIEQAVEIQKLHLEVNPEDPDAAERIRNARVLLSFLQFRHLGLHAPDFSYQ